MTWPRRYTVRVRELDSTSSSNGSYTALEGQHSPCLLDGLTAGRQYEFYVTAVNEHGEGAESSRVLFQVRGGAGWPLCGMLRDTWWYRLILLFQVGHLLIKHGK